MHASRGQQSVVVPTTQQSSARNEDTHALPNMASFFKQLSDDMEKVVQVVEEGAKFMMGESTRMGGEGSDAESPSTAFGDDVHINPDGDAIFDDMDDMDGSPLMGMADSVLSDIMSMQVCDTPSAAYLVKNCATSSPSFA